MTTTRQSPVVTVDSSPPEEGTVYCPPFVRGTYKNFVICVYCHDMNVFATVNVTSHLLK